MTTQPRMATADQRREFACFPAAVLAFVINEQDEVLLLSHPARKGSWEVVNGAIEEGESPADALLREVAEEAGAEVVIRPVGIVHAFLYPYDAAVKSMISISYAATYLGGRVSPGGDMTMSEHRWVGLPEIEAGGMTLLVPSQAWLFRRAVAVCRAFRDDDVELEPWQRLMPRSVVASSRVLSVILFTDVVDSTPAAVAAGDAEWIKLLGRHETLSHSIVERHLGRIVTRTGDGLVAIFASAAAAVSAAKALQVAADALGLKVRAGVHVGEVEMAAFDVHGQAVVVASRICDAAGAGEVLMSRTAADLLAGSDVHVGEHRRVLLKGLGEFDAYIGDA